MILYEEQAIPMIWSDDSALLQYVIDKAKAALQDRVSQIIGTQPHMVKYNEELKADFESPLPKTLVRVSAEVEPVTTMKVVIPEFTPLSWDAPRGYLPNQRYCRWCGSVAKDDKYHSGTCENCGGPR